MRWRTIGAAALMAGVLLGCEQGQGDAEGNKGEPAPTTSAAVEAQPPAQTASLDKVQFDAPGDWAKQVRGAWHVYTSPDTHSVLALAALDAGEVVRTRLDEAAKVLGASDVHWSEDQPIDIGPDRLPARAADSPCRFHGGDGRIAYAAADLGAGQRVLVIHLAAKDAPEGAQKTAMLAVGSIRRKN